MSDNNCHIYVNMEVTNKLLAEILEQLKKIVAKLSPPERWHND